MFLKIARQYKTQLFISIILSIVLIALKVTTQPVQIGLIVLGTLLGTFILDLDYFIHAYFLEPTSDFSKTLTGFMITFSIAVSIFFASKLAKKKNLDSDILYGGMFWVILSGIIGARLYHVVHYWSFYSENPALIFNLRTGGMAIYGAIIFGVAAALIYLKIKRQRITDWIDLGG